MSDWMLAQTEEVSTGSTHTRYRLYGWGTPDAATPYEFWYVERTQSSASFLNNETTDYASWVSGPTDSDAAWTGRAGLTYGPNVISSPYAGNPVTLTESGVCEMSYTGELTPVALPEDTWTDVSGEMVSGTSYRLVMPGETSAKVIIAAAAPASAYADQVGIEIGHQDAGRVAQDLAFKFNGDPIWVNTLHRGGIAVQIWSVG